MAVLYIQYNTTITFTIFFKLHITNCKFQFQLADLSSRNQKSKQIKYRKFKIKIKKKT